MAGRAPYNGRMLAEETLARQVREVLAHLHDLAYLQTHPLAAALVSAGRPPSGGALRRALLEAIDQLKPPSGTPERSPAWRPHQLLDLRYAQGVPPPEIAPRLGIGERQVRREHHEALEAVASIIRTRLAPSQEVPVGPTADAALRAELDRLSTEDISGSVRLGEVVEGVAATLAQLAASRGATLTVDLPPDLPPVATSRTILRQALLALLAHVLERASDTRVTVTASPSPQQVALVVVVSPAAALDQGELGERALPVIALGATLERHEAGDWSAVEIALPITRSTSVLIIDDNRDFIYLCRRYLEGTPYWVLVATVAEEALRLAREERPDVIVLDVLMPTQDGWEILQRLRGCPEGAKVPIVVCSVLRETGIAFSLGATHFLPKPVTRQSLVAALEHCLRAGVHSLASAPVRPHGTPSGIPGLPRLPGWRGTNAP